MAHSVNLFHAIAPRDGCKIHPVIMESISAFILHVFATFGPGGNKSSLVSLMRTADHCQWSRRADRGMFLLYKHLHPDSCPPNLFTGSLKGFGWSWNERKLKTKHWQYFIPIEVYIACCVTAFLEVSGSPIVCRIYWGTLVRNSVCKLPGDQP